MANPQTAKTPKLNALLIGKRTVPSGCKVLNVSQQGMSLHCNPDGRLLTFSSGDAVDIFLSVQHANGHNKFTIPAIVSHVDESLIDVVFHCTDTELAGLIESYRTSESHDLEATIDHRLINKTGTQSRPVAVNEALSGREGTDSTTRRSAWSFYTGLMLLFIISMVSLGAYYYISSFNQRLSSLESVSSTHTSELAEIQSQVFSSRLQDGRYASLNARMKALADAFQSFEKRVSTALLQGSPAPVTPDQAITDKTAAGSTAESQDDTPISQQPAPEVKQPVTRTEPVQATAPKAVTAAAPKQTTITEKQAAVNNADADNPVSLKYPSIEHESVALATTSKPVGTAIRKQSTKDESPTRIAGSAGSPKTSPASSPGKPASIAMTAPQPQVEPSQSLPAKRPATASPAPVTAGPWVINLLSSPSKAYVEEMLATAQSSGVDAVMNRAEVKGKQYWRLQLAGFDSMSAAKEAAEPVKDLLKINDVWIFKRKR